MRGVVGHIPILYGEVVLSAEGGNAKTRDGSLYNHAATPKNKTSLAPVFQRISVS